MKTNIININYYWHVPLILLDGYLVLTVFVFIVLNLENLLDPNILNLIAYISINYFAFALGYIPLKYNIKISNTKGNRKLKLGLISIMSIILIISALYNISVFYSDFKHISSFISKPGMAYEYVKHKENYESINGISKNNIVAIILNALSFLKYYYISITLLYWKEYKNRQKLFAVITIIIILFDAILLGAMIGVAALLFSQVPIILFFWTKSNRRIIKIVEDLLFILAIAIIILAYFLGTRYLYARTPLEIIKNGIDGLIYYISHGYEGLSKCLSLEFTSTFGQSSFRGISIYFIKYLHINDYWQNSYLFKNELINGWPSLQLWSTAFAWWASDISFYFTPLIMFFLGKWIRELWLYSIMNNSLNGFVLLGQLFIEIIMLPANNQLFQTFANAIGFLIICFLYFRERFLGNNLL